MRRRVPLPMSARTIPTPKSHVWGSHVIEFFAIGTAVRPLRADHLVAQPQMVLTLDP